ncbi:MAG: zf-HC2 domain-containing protein [Planctomycetota bacterium]
MREQLGPYLDDELGSEASRALEDHLTDCRPCAEELDSLQELAADLAWQGPATVPDALWTSIEERLDRVSENSPQRPAFGRKLRMFRRPLAAAASILLVVGLGVAGLIWVDGSASRAEASTIDFGELLDALPVDARSAFRKFLTQYDAKEISVHGANQYAPKLSFAIPESLPGGFRLGPVYAVRFGEDPGIAAEYWRDDEFLATLFHRPVRREDFGTHKDHPCVIGKHRGRTVVVGPWRMVHLTDPTTCHCVLSKLDLKTELPAVMAAVAPELPASAVDRRGH